MRAAVGGTGFVKGMWGLKDQLYLKMLEMTDYALSLNQANRVVGFLWHQGECDAFEKNEPDVFKQQLASMIRDVRVRYGTELPFIAGDLLSNNQKTGNGDDIHFCREALYVLGRRYFSAYKDVCKK